MSNPVKTCGKLAAVLAAATSLTALALAPVSAQAPAPAPVQDSVSPETHPQLYKVPTLPDYTPEMTPWGVPDLRGIWPTDSLGGLPMQRTPEQGNRVFLTDEEFGKREASMERWRGAAEAETKANKLGMGNWVEMTGAGRRTSLLIDPVDGQLPGLTERGKQLASEMRSSWVPGQTFDWVDDFDSWDRCVSRAFPASMLPFRYNNGIRIFQAPDTVVIDLEMIHDSRIIYTDGRPFSDGRVRSWMGESRGHWEGNTLVIETRNIMTGGAPLNMATIGAPPNNTIPMSENARVFERLTLANEGVLVYEFTYQDDEMWEAPFTVRLNWQRNQDYQFFEYACHEGNVQIRNYITASRSTREREHEAGRMQ